ncbi:MAG: coenzyme F420-0:L-glutamate ligase [Oligoflexia bacterium]|nr:coenzyme F420-0:L-glutamate ligase [Oligoflexia bacterium]
MNVTAIQTPVFHPGQDLLAFLDSQLPKLENGDCLAITSKIVSLWQNKLVSALTDKKTLVIKHADRVLCESYKTYLTIKEGILIAAAGIDESNSETGAYILWPDQPFMASKTIWEHLIKTHGLTSLGVILTDSHCTPLRKGVSGIALSHWGFKGVQSHIGKPDIFGRPMIMSQTNVADSLASAAVYVMGEVAEQSPIALIRNAPFIEFCSETDPLECRMPPEEDIFGPVFSGYKEMKP